MQKWWNETWGDVVWRHNVLVLLSGLTVIAAGLLMMLAVWAIVRG